MQARSPAWRRRLAQAGVAGAVATLVLTACGGGSSNDHAGPGTPVPETPAPETPAAALRLSVLSSPADKVTGNDALVQVEVLRSQADSTLTITANGTDVTAAFAPDASGKLLGKLDNLAAGANEVVATYGSETARLALTAHAITGPVISGPHQSPFVCNLSFAMPAGVPALTTIPGDPDCGVETRVDYLYRTTANTYVYLPDPSALADYPANLRTITVEGRSVPYVVRLETGTINRAIYQSAILHDVLNEPAPSPVARPAGFTGKLFYPLGGGCQGGWFQQGANANTVLSDGYLGKGYGVTSSSLNVMGQNCNDLLSSETVMMVKERFIENYGVPFWTVGTGGSGGAYQSNQTGDNYPGLFDGIIISQVFTDVNSSTLFKLFDSRLLHNYFNGNGGYTTAQKQAISGYLQIGNISAMSNSAGRIDPTVSFPAGVTAGVGPNHRYHAVTNRGGARASVYDHTKNVYGVTAEGHALRPIDNVGIQYGMKALLDGVITPAQFVDLNQKIGGLDRDLQPQTHRTEGDRAALERAYQSGRIVWGGGGLASMPIIDRRDYKDAVVAGDIHTKIHSFSLRERLRAANGHVDNHVILTSDGGGAGVDTTAAMDTWLSAIKTDASEKPLAQKVVANRPSTLVDGCLINNTFVAETQVASGPTGCNAVFPAGTTPRMAAGGPLADDIAKCQLKPLDPADYPGVTFTQPQWISLQLAFPDGVCDWSKPGVGQQASRPWLSFGPSTTDLLFDITK